MFCLYFHIEVVSPVATEVNMHLNFSYAPVVDPSSYCVQVRTGTPLNYQQAIAKCAELGPGWSIPVIRDATMNAKLLDYYG